MQLRGMRTHCLRAQVLQAAQRKGAAGRIRLGRISALLDIHKHYRGVTPGLELREGRLSHVLPVLYMLRFVLPGPRLKMLLSPKTLSPIKAKRQIFHSLHRLTMCAYDATSGHAISIMNSTSVLTYHDPP